MQPHHPYSSDWKQCPCLDTHPKKTTACHDTDTLQHKIQVKPYCQSSSIQTFIAITGAVIIQIYSNYCDNSSHFTELCNLKEGNVKAKDGNFIFKHYLLSCIAIVILKSFHKYTRTFTIFLNTLKMTRIKGQQNTPLVNHFFVHQNHLFNNISIGDYRLGQNIAKLNILIPLLLGNGKIPSLNSN